MSPDSNATHHHHHHHHIAFGTTTTTNTGAAAKREVDNSTFVLLSKACNPRAGMMMENAVGDVEMVSETSHSHCRRSHSCSFSPPEALSLASSHSPANSLSSTSNPLSPAHDPRSFSHDGFAHDCANDEFANGSFSLEGGSWAGGSLNATAPLFVPQEDSRCSFDSPLFAPSSTPTALNRKLNPALRSQEIESQLMQINLLAASLSQSLNLDVNVNFNGPFSPSPLPAVCEDAPFSRSFSFGADTLSPATKDAASPFPHGQGPNSKNRRGPRANRTQSLDFSQNRGEGEKQKDRLKRQMKLQIRRQVKQQMKGSSNDLSCREADALRRSHSEGAGELFNCAPLDALQRNSFSMISA